MQLVLDTNGLSLKKRNNSFWLIHKKKGQRLISPHRVSSIAIVSDCLLSTAAIKLAAQYKIPILFFNRTAKAEARLWSHNFGSIATIRRNQVLLQQSIDGTALMIRFFQQKIQQQILLLEWTQEHFNSSHKSQAAIENLQNTILKLDGFQDKKIDACRANILGIEGQMAKIYWKALSDALPSNWQFKVRSRRPALDSFNAALNYLYGMLYNVVESSILSAGLDPYLGIFHTDNYNKPTLTYDMIEPYRPWVDRLLLVLILQKKLTSKVFEAKNQSYHINKKGRKILIIAFNDWMQETTQFDKKKMKRKNHINRQASKVAQQLKSFTP